MLTLITGLAADPANSSAAVLSTLDMSAIGSALRFREGPLLAWFLKLTIDDGVVLAGIALAFV